MAEGFITFDAELFQNIDLRRVGFDDNGHIHFFVAHLFHALKGFQEEEGFEAFSPVFGENSHRGNFGPCDFPHSPQNF